MKVIGRRSKYSLTGRFVKIFEEFIAKHFNECYSDILNDRNK